MTDPRHRKPDRKRGYRLRSRSGRRRTTVDDPLSRSELKSAAQANRTRKARRRIALAITVALLTVWTAVVLSWWLGQRASEDVPDVPVAEVPPEGVGALFAVVDADGWVRSLTLLAASDEAGDRAVLFHPSLLVTLPGFGENLLSNAVRFDEDDLLGIAVANLMGIRIDEVIVWTEDDIAEAIESTIVIDLPQPLIVADGTAQVVIAGKGPIGRDGPSIARLLTDQGLGTELDLLQRQGAVWEALLGQLASDDVTVERLVGGQGSAARASLVGTATGEPVLTVVPATRIEPTGDEERYQLDGVDAAQFVSQHLQYLQLAPEPRIRIEVLNGNGLIGTTRPVAALLVRAGFRVVVTDNADRSDFESTLVIAQGRDFQQAALDAREILGIGEVSVEILQPSGVVDLTIIVGQDLPAGGDG